VNATDDIDLAVPVRERSRETSTQAKVAETAFTNGVVAALGVATSVIAARWLGAEGRGELAAIQMWPSLLASVAMLGMAEALVYFCAKHPSQSRQYLVTAGTITLVAMPLFVVAGYLLLPHLLSNHSPAVVQSARTYLLLIPLFTFLGLPYHLLRGIQRYRLWNAMRVVPIVIWLLVLVTAVLTGIADPTRITRIYLIALTSVSPVLIWIIWQRSAGPAAPTTGAAGGLLKFGAPSVLVALPQLFSLNLDQVAVAAVMPATELGVYMVAIAWGACIPMLSNALAIVVSTQLAAGASDPHRNRRFVEGIRYGAWMIVACVLAVIAGTPLGLTLVFGAGFQAAVIPAAILVVASGANAFNRVLEELLRGLGHPVATLTAQLAALGVGLPAMYVLLPRAGLRGAAMASLIGYLAGMAVLLAQSRRVAGLRLLDALDPRPILTSVRPRLSAAMTR
jgi:O-antigen/teichoic acid export membrane protein